MSIDVGLDACHGVSHQDRGVVGQCHRCGTKLAG
jgi:hypothetical protein